MAAERQSQQDTAFERAYAAVTTPTTSVEIIRRLVAQAAERKGDN